MSPAMKTDAHVEAEDNVNNTGKTSCRRKRVACVFLRFAQLQATTAPQASKPNIRKAANRQGHIPSQTPCAGNARPAKQHMRQEASICRKDASRCGTQAPFQRRTSETTVQSRISLEGASTAGLQVQAEKQDRTILTLTSVSRNGRQLD